MDYKDTVKIMLNQGLIKKQKVDFSPIEALLLRAHTVSKIEAENALKTAEEFVKIAMKLIQKENPQLRLSFND